MRRLADVESVELRPKIARMAFFEKEKPSLGIYVMIPMQPGHKLHEIEKGKNKQTSARQLQKDF